MELQIRYLFAAITALLLLTPVRIPLGYAATYTAIPAHVLLVLQTHQPTKHGSVPHLQPQEETTPAVKGKIKLDPAQLTKEGKELLGLSQSLQADIESVNHGMHPKDITQKLKRIQKLAKHLKQEIEP